MSVNWAIVGYGDIVRNEIIQAIRASKRSQLIGVMRRDKIKAEKTAKKHKIKKYYGSIEEIGKDREVDAVYIATPPFLHSLQTIKLANYGKHVLCEKPMAISIEECQRMIDSTSANDVKLMIGHCFRFHPCIMKIKQLLSRKVLGEIAYIKISFSFICPPKSGAGSWYYNPKMSGGGPMMDLGVHCIDTLRYILQKEIKKVNAISKPIRSNSEIELTILTLIEFEEGLQAVVENSFKVPRNGGEIEIFGSNGILYGEGIFENKQGQMFIKHENKKDNLQVKHKNIYRIEIDHFVECIERDYKPLISGWEGMKNMKVAFAAYFSSQTGRTVTLT